MSHPLPYLWFAVKKGGRLICRKKMEGPSMNWKLVAVKTLPFVFFAACFFLKTIWGEVPNWA
jgi:hypothetical protein